MISYVSRMSTGRIPVDGTSLYYEITGSGSPIVFLHGFALDHRLWDDQVAAFSAGHRVVRYDLRGFGQSPPGSVPYTHAGDLHALLDHLALDRAALVGLSMGGGAAINYAVLHPERVSALVVVDPSLGGYKWSGGFSTAQSGTRNLAQTEGVAAARARWLASPIFRHVPDTEPAGQRLRAMVDDYSGYHWLNADLGQPFTPPAIERLHEITAPTLVVVGELDTRDFHEIANTLGERVPNARRVVMPGVGHFANVEAAAEFNALVTAFLRDVSV
jgi:3-oxoadipate enol-lactonase